MINSNLGNYFKIMKKNENKGACVLKAGIIKFPLIITLSFLLSLINVLAVNAGIPARKAGSAAEELLQQQQQLTGTVTDASTGELLPGVNVVIEGTVIGATTDMNGKFSLQTPAQNAVVVFSFIGYTTSKVTYTGQTSLSIKLEPDVTKLEEIIVTGYSVEKKKDIIGSVSVINTDEMLQTNNASVGGQLQGRATGIIVTSDGSPSGASKIRIRGFGSFGQADPLYIIDGVPATSDAFNNLNPNDVESIQVLKDAASASVYGARAANGVLVISTKKGKIGGAKISVDSYTGINYVSSKDFPDLLNTQEYGEYWWLASQGAGLTPTHAQYGSDAVPNVPEYIKAGTYTGAALEAMRTSNPTLFASATDPENYNFITNQIIKSADTDWFDEVFNPAALSNIQLSASGGSDVGTYSISMNYLTQDQTANTYAYYKRYTTRANSSFNVNRNIKLGENLQVTYTNSSGNGSAGSAWNMNPILPVWDIKGNPTGGAAAGLSQATNPIAANWRNRFNKNNNFGVFGNIYADLTFLKDFVARTSFGIDYSNGNSFSLSQQTYENAQNTSATSVSRNMSWGSAWTWTNTLTYSKSFGDHAVKLLVGSEAINTYSDNLSGSRQDYDVNDDPNFVTLSTGLGTQSNSGSFSRQMLSSLFGRLDYTYSDKYLFNATLRRDGSSKFGINNRYGIFPAVGLGWRISSEDFMQGLTWLNDLKLRATYGVIGNQTGLSAENQYTRYAKSISGGYALTGGNTVASGFSVSAIGNPDARWEKNITTNVGFDATMFDDKLSATFEYYVKVTDDLLVQNQAPQTGSSATQPSINIGKMTNRGVDLNLTNRGNIIDGLSYEASVNFSAYKNNVDKILDNKDAYLIGASNSTIGVTTRTIQGYPISYIWGYQIDGFFETQAEVDAYAAEYTTYITPKVGRWRIKDINGDKKITELDKTQLGSPHPDFQVGFNLALNYKNFDFSTFVFWNQGGQVFNLSRMYTDFNMWTYNRSARMLYQSWTPGADNTNALLPKLDISDSQSPSQSNDYWVEDVTYLRLKTMQLGYTFPTSLTRRINVDKLRVYVQGQNLFTAIGGKKPFSGLDPGTALSGNDLSMGMVDNQNPTPRQLVFGVNMSF